jgi:hypothetical protein
VDFGTLRRVYRGRYPGSDIREAGGSVRIGRGWRSRSTPPDFKFLNVGALNEKAKIDAIYVVEAKVA